MKDQYKTLETTTLVAVRGSHVVDGLCLRTGPASSTARFFETVREFQVPEGEEGRKEIEVWQPYVGRSYWGNSPSCDGEAENSVVIKLLDATRGWYDTQSWGLERLMILRYIPFKTCAEVAGLSLRAVTERFEASDEVSLTTFGLDFSQTEIWEREGMFRLDDFIGKEVFFPDSGDEVEIRKPGFESGEKTRCAELTDPETLAKHVLYFGSLEEVAVPDSKPVFDLEFPKSAPPRGTTTLIIIGSVVGGILVLAALFFVGRHVVMHKNKEEKEKLSLRPV